MEETRSDVPVKQDPPAKLQRVLPKENTVRVRNLIKKYEKLSKDQDKAGSLTEPLQRTRQKLDKELMSKARDEISNVRDVFRAL